MWPPEKQWQAVFCAKHQLFLFIMNAIIADISSNPLFYLQFKTISSLLPVVLHKILAHPVKIFGSVNSGNRR